jgi:hypothetical protein
MCVWQWASCLSIIDTTTKQAALRQSKDPRRRLRRCQPPSQSSPAGVARCATRGESRSQVRHRKDSIILKHLLIRAQTKTSAVISLLYSCHLATTTTNNAHRFEIRVLSPLFPHFASILQYQFRIQPVRTTGTSSLAGNPISAIVHAGRLVAPRVWLRLSD